MLTVEAIVEKGQVRLLNPVYFPTARRALVTFLNDKPEVKVEETTLLSEAALAEDWNREEEVAAWSVLQPGK